MIAKRLKGIALQLAHHRLTRSYGIRLLAAQREEGQFNSESWVVRARIQDAKPILQWSWSFFHAASQVDLVYMHAHAHSRAFNAASHVWRCLHGVAVASHLSRSRQPSHGDGDLDLPHFYGHRRHFVSCLLHPLPISPPPTPLSPLLICPTGTRSSSPRLQLSLQKPPSHRHASTAPRWTWPTSTCAIYKCHASSGKRWDRTRGFAALHRPALPIPVPVPVLAPTCVLS